ncbi:hypothetical protein [Streptomyces atriruber]|uniref:hypothetical protein n=1 Tax=Streptomyces atriruber TaxID=545121 RepID=UPI0006E20178|nr:hypothetical protein [Streptomyces atriruber]
MPAHHRHAPSPRRTAAIALVGLLCAAGAACSQPTPEPGGAPPPAITKVRYSEPSSADVIPMLFPATGVESRRTQGLTGLLALAQDVRTKACTTPTGGAPADDPPAMFVRRMALPDLAYVRAHGFTSPPVPTLAASPRCADATEERITSLGKMIAPLQARWWKVVESVNDEPTVQRAYTKLKGCFAGHGLAADDEDAFFGVVDSRLSARGSDPRAAEREDRRLGALYARCMAPVEAVREGLRQQRRKAFLKSHSAEVGRLQNTLPERLDQVEDSFDVHYSAPTP